MMPHSAVVGYQCFRGSCCLYLKGDVTGDGKKGKNIGLEFKKGRWCFATSATRGRKGESQLLNPTSCHRYHGIIRQFRCLHPARSEWAQTAVSEEARWNGTHYQGSDGE
jgi:hypothetical protein